MPPPSARAVALSAGALAGLALLLHRRQTLASAYNRYSGIYGLLRLIWLGDHLPPHLREAMDELDDVEARVTKSEGQLEQIEVLVARARLDSVDGSVAANATTSASASLNEVDREELKTQLFKQYPELRTQIAIFSNKRDALAAAIDHTKSHGDEEVKRRKKRLSNQIVALMDELDATVESLDLAPR
ncbi:hypothetical protein ACHAXT_002552 [Thalassiosira profunda]